MRIKGRVRCSQLLCIADQPPRPLSPTAHHIQKRVIRGSERDLLSLFRDGPPRHDAVDCRVGSNESWDRTAAPTPLLDFEKQVEGRKGNDETHGVGAGAEWCGGGEAIRQAFGRARDLGLTGSSVRLSSASPFQIQGFRRPDQHLGAVTHSPSDGKEKYRGWRAQAVAVLVACVGHLLGYLNTHQPDS